MYKVFLSYNTTRDDTVIVWRLQTLAAASGIHLEVPNPIQRSDWATVAQMIEKSDAVIAFITKSFTKQVNRELEYAQQRFKRIIPLVEQGISLETVKPLLQSSGTPFFVFDPAHPWEVEQRLAEYLKTEERSKTAREALLALAGVALGLFLLQEVSKS